MIASPIRLPMNVHCPKCGKRWTQNSTWKQDTILLCSCGEPAFKDKDEEEFNGRRGV